MKHLNSMLLLLSELEALAIDIKQNHRREEVDQELYGQRTSS